MTDRPAEPDEPPGPFARCDMGHCSAPAMQWFYDKDFGNWIPASQFCLFQEQWS